MNRSDFLAAFLAAAFLHVAAALGVNCLVGHAVSAPALPKFKAGISAIELTLLQPTPREETVPPHPRPDEAVRLQEKPEQEPVEQDAPRIEDTESVAIVEPGVIMPDADDFSIYVRYPTYPEGSRLRGEEGLVRIATTLNAFGRAENVAVSLSSGYRALDRAALKAVAGAEFPAGSAGRAVTIAIRFKLTD